MKARPFSPGFRISWLDTIILAAGICALLFAPGDFAWIIGAAVGHFFLFCNVFRMSRKPELIWATTFTLLSSATLHWNAPPWPVTVAISFLLAAVLIALETRKPRYHGVAWQKLNPRLPDWWKAQQGGSAPSPATSSDPNMLKELDAIDWSSLEDAYGSADEVPNRLRALLSDDKAARSEAFSKLFGSVWHQGTVYSASAHVIPFLVELIAAPHVQDKPSIIALLASIAGGRGYFEVHEPILQKLAKRPIDVSENRREEARAVDAVRRAASPHIPGLLPHLTHLESEVRLAIAEALPYYPEHAVRSKAALAHARVSETDLQIVEAIDEALAALSPST